MINRRGFLTTSLGVAPAFLLIGLPSNCGNNISNIVKYLDLAVSALDVSLPTILGATATPIINWANVIANALTSAANTLSSVTMNTADKVLAVAKAFNGIVLPNLASIGAEAKAKIDSIIQAVGQFLNAMGLTSTALPSAGGVMVTHVTSGTSFSPAVASANIVLSKKDTTIIVGDVAKLQGMIARTRL